MKLHASPESVEDWFRDNCGMHVMAPRLAGVLFNSMSILGV